MCIGRLKNWELEDVGKIPAIKNLELKDVRKVGGKYTGKLEFELCEPPNPSSFLERIETPTSFSVRPIFNGTVRPEVGIASWFLFSDNKFESITYKGIPIWSDLMPEYYKSSSQFPFRERVYEAQKEHSLNLDGIIGKNTWRAICKGKVKPPIGMRIQSFIAEVETGHARDAYGFREADIGDGAGSNFGVVQHNSRGSLKSLMEDPRAPKRFRNGGYKSATRNEIGDWMGSLDGIKLQNIYFYEHILNSAVVLLDKYDLPYSERLLTLLCDIKVQNGSLVSPYRKPLNVSDFNGRWDKYLGTFIKWNEVQSRLGNLTANARDANAHMIENIFSRIRDISNDPKNYGIALALYRSRCSRQKYRTAVEQRKLTIVLPTRDTWQGNIHGTDIDMFDDFGVGEKR